MPTKNWDGQNANYFVRTPMWFSQDIFARVDVAQNGSVYLGDFVAALTCVPKRRSVEVIKTKH